MMAKPAKTEVASIGSFLSLGSLLIVAGVLSYGIHKLNGEWPVGLEGRVGTLFLVFGIIFVGASLMVQIRARRAVRE